MLYEMLTGNPPFVSDTDSDFKVHQAHVYQQPEPLRKRNPQVPFEFEWIVLKALNKDRERRFSSAREMATALREGADKGALVVVAAPETFQMEQGDRVMREILRFLFCDPNK